MKKSITGWVLILTLLASPQVSYAVGSAGFENASYSAYSLSQANAVTAQAEEPASISYNPAGIAQLKGVQAQSNSGFINAITRISHNDDIAYSSGTMSYVPTGYATINSGKILNDRLTLGFGSDSPFGLSNKFDSNHPATRYTGFKNWIKMFTLKPTAAYQVTDWLSVGAGAMYYDIFNMGTIMAYPSSTISSVFPNAPDGQLRANLRGASWGWQMGALLKPSPMHQFGFYFRSPVKVRASGQVKVENAFYASTPHFQTGAYTNVDFPMNMTLGYAFKATPKTTYEADFGYTRWSTYNRLHVTRTDSINTDAFFLGISPLFAGADNALLDNIGTSSSADRDYSDTFSLHLGVNHKLKDWLRLMGGFLFYSGAVAKNHFTPAIPDSNRIAFSLGTSWDISRMVTLDLAYLNELGLRRSINNDISESIPGATVDGKYFTDYNALLVTLKIKWEDAFEKFVRKDEGTTPLLKPQATAKAPTK